MWLKDDYRNRVKGKVMMDPIVKEFIEENIDVLEAEMWFLFFVEWYNNRHKSFPDTEQFNELMYVLQRINKNIEQDTKKYREGTIITMTRANIDEVRKNVGLWTTPGKIPLSYLLERLNSVLGLSNAEIFECIHDAAKTEGLEYDIMTNQFTWEV